MTFTSQENSEKSRTPHPSSYKSRFNAWESSNVPRPSKKPSQKTISANDLLRVCDMLDPELSEITDVKKKKSEALHLHAGSKMRIRTWKGTKEDQMKRLIEERKKRLEKEEADRVTIDEAYEKELKVETKAFLAQKRFLQLAETPEAKEQTSQLILEHVLKERAIQIELKKKKLPSETTVLSDPFLSHISPEPTRSLSSTIDYEEVQSREKLKRQEEQQKKEEEKHTLTLMQSLCKEVLEKENKLKREKQERQRKLLDEQVATRKKIQIEEKMGEIELDKICSEWKKKSEWRGKEREKVEQSRKEERENIKMLMIENELINQPNRRKDILIGQGNSLFMHDKQSEKMFNNIKSRHHYNAREEYGKMLEKHRISDCERRKEMEIERKELERLKEIEDIEKLRKLGEVKSKRAEIAKCQLNQIREKKERDGLEKIRYNAINIVGVKFDPLEMEHHLKFTKQLTQQSL
ncbi:hypothetical protein HMI54_011436 [Coelomomyces lativittatus]|nr:hypothetical protein HMI56_000061 [Coelomomyces lativittatus]KAJ1515908.1 hypothetical protein HMI54_011436 [Coelomomyces lativittatus]KAJ1517766.1 hypothetical protein HMI55_006080 [Coelomomyces lativittatus]